MYVYSLLGPFRDYGIGSEEEEDNSEGEEVVSEDNSESDVRRTKVHSEYVPMDTSSMVDEVGRAKRREQEEAAKGNGKYEWLVDFFRKEIVTSWPLHK